MLAVVLLIVCLSANGLDKTIR